MGLEFIVAAGLHQHSLPWNSWPYFTVSILRLPQVSGEGSCIYLFQEEGSPVILWGNGFLCNLYISDIFQSRIVTAYYALSNVAPVTTAVCHLNTMTDLITYKIVLLRTPHKLDSFHCAGKYPLSRTALNNWVRYFIPIIGSFFRILPVMRS
jgi:hypothetical protein